MQRAKTAFSPTRTRNSAMIPTAEDIEWARRVYKKYLDEVDKADSEYSLQVFQSLHSEDGDKIVPQKREVKKPSEKVFKILAYAEEKKPQLRSTSRLLLPTRAQTSFSHYRSTDPSIKHRHNYKPNFPCHDPGFIPQTSHLDNRSQVVPCRVHTGKPLSTEMRSKVVYRHVVDVGPVKTHNDYIKQKLKKEEEETIQQAKLFDDRNYAEYKLLHHDLKRREDRGRESALKSKSFTPESAII